MALSLQEATTLKHLEEILESASDELLENLHEALEEEIATREDNGQ